MIHKDSLCKEGMWVPREGEMHRYVGGEPM
jgi:hypothetical protein